MKTKQLETGELTLDNNILKFEGNDKQMGGFKSNEKVFDYIISEREFWREKEHSEEIHKLECDVANARQLVNAYANPYNYNLRPTL
jgi:hypothetical protein